MSGPIDLAMKLASNTARVGWFYGVNRLIADRLVPPDRQSNYKPARPVPTRGELFGDLRQLLIEDAADASKGTNPGSEWRPRRLSRHIDTLRAMLRDLPTTVERREQGVYDTAKAFASEDDLPEYYAQDFHFQTGGHLTEESARIYDVQVETLFYGSADAMRRAAFRPIHDYMSGRDQRKASLLDVACGTGRFLRDVRRLYPRITLAGLDLSPAYLEEAERHLGDLRPVRWLRANAEAMPVETASQDVVTSIFLFHELPPEARRAVIGEVARVLKPGGIFVMIDSLQYDDKPGWDGLLEAFPERFHEPYYRHYLIDDLPAAFERAGLTLTGSRLIFLSKLLAFVKPGEAGQESDQ
ncbi:MAG: class I SAM-dependent methyltransferase [Alphaproteobacteria bacterium]|nr:class I SAM-dependent methyltransferase [Alphaproteobacteria bacterium]